MDIKETQEIIISYLKSNNPFLNHRRNKTLIYENTSFKIRPDDSFYYKNCLLLVEYENNKRPVESVSKYYWLFQNTNWLEVGLKIRLLLTINKKGISSIRTETIQLLGTDIKEKYPSKFDFYFIGYNDLSKENLIFGLENLSADEYAKAY